MLNNAWQYAPPYRLLHPVQLVYEYYTSTHCNRNRIEWLHCNGTELAWSVQVVGMETDDPMNWTTNWFPLPLLCRLQLALLVVMSLMWKMWMVDAQFSSLGFSNAMGHRWSLLLKCTPTPLVSLSHWILHRLLPAHAGSMPTCCLVKGSCWTVSCLRAWFSGRAGSFCNTAIPM